jgi:uncharacterized protein YraI
MRASTYLRLLVGAALLTLSAGAVAQNAVTSESASVRAGPDNSYPEVAQLDADSPIQVMGCLDDWSWCDVAFEGTRGWLYSPDITYAYQGGYVPLYSYAPALGISVVAFSVDSYWGSYYHDRPFYGQRDQWVHRTIRHQRPPGPPPSHSPPPHDVVRAGPHPGSGQQLRLGSAEASRRDAQQHADAQRQGGSADHVDSKAREARAPEAKAPEARTAEPRPQEHAAPPAERAVSQHQDAHAQRQDEHARPAERAVAPQHEEQQHRAAPAKAEGPPPKKEEQGDRPK